MPVNSIHFLFVPEMIFVDIWVNVFDNLCYKFSRCACTSRAKFCVWNIFDSIIYVKIYYVLRYIHIWGLGGFGGISTYTKLDVIYRLSISCCLHWSFFEGLPSQRSFCKTLRFARYFKSLSPQRLVQSIFSHLIFMIYEHLGALKMHDDFKWQHFKYVLHWLLYASAFFPFYFYFTLCCVI